MSPSSPRTVSTAAARSASVTMATAPLCRARYTRSLGRRIVELGMARQPALSRPTRVTCHSGTRGSIRSTGSPGAVPRVSSRDATRLEARATSPKARRRSRPAALRHQRAGRSGGWRSTTSRPKLKASGSSQRKPSRARRWASRASAPCGSDSARWVMCLLPALRPRSPAPALGPRLSGPGPPDALVCRCPQGAPAPVPAPRPGASRSAPPLPVLRRPWARV